MVEARYGMVCIRLTRQKKKRTMHFTFCTYFLCCRLLVTQGVRNLVKHSIYVIPVIISPNFVLSQNQSKASIILSTVEYQAPSRPPCLHIFYFIL